MNDLHKWIRIRKDLYLQMEKQVRHRLGEDTPELMRYHKVYQREFNKKWQVVSQQALWDQLAESQVVMIGDFHALHQSQKAQVRVLRHVPKERSKVLAVEFFEAADQDKVDKYLEGKLSEKDFLKAIHWQSRWGFPWESYRPLMRWAQKNKIPVYGINKSFKRRNAATLKSRDLFAGKKIAEIVRKYPEALTVVIYGDMHLAGPHITAEVVKQMGPAFSKKILRIFQNSEKIYFQLLQQELEATTDLVRLSKNSFCLLSVPPWVKWQNYLMYLEQAYDQGLGFSDDDDEDDDYLDYTDHVGRYVKIISEELGCPVSTDKLSVYTARDPSFWSKLPSNYDAKRLRWIEDMIADEMSFYLPEIGAAYLARTTVNHAATLAMKFIHAQLEESPVFYANPPEDFLRMIWIEAVAYFGSKIINHKRKADTIADIKASLASRGPVDLGKEALQLSLAQKMHELMTITGVPGHRLQARPRRKWSYMMAANLLGGMMGERLYGGYRKNLISSAAIVSFLKKPLRNENFEIAYYGMLEVVEALPAPFHSKKEKL